MPTAKRQNSLSRQEIESAVRFGRSLHSPLFSIRLSNVKEENFLTSKVAFSAPKKIFPTAVARNRAKRKAREAYATLSKDFVPAKMVFILKKDILNSKLEDISKEMLRLLRKN